MNNNIMDKQNKGCGDITPITRPTKRFEHEEVLDRRVVTKNEKKKNSQFFLSDNSRSSIPGYQIRDTLDSPPAAPWNGGSSSSFYSSQQDMDSKMGSRRASYSADDDDIDNDVDDDNEFYSKLYAASGGLSHSILLREKKTASQQKNMDSKMCSRRASSYFADDDDVDDDNEFYSKLYAASGGRSHSILERWKQSNDHHSSSILTPPTASATVTNSNRTTRRQQEEVTRRQPPVVTTHSKKNSCCSSSHPPDNEIIPGFQRFHEKTPESPLTVHHHQHPKKQSRGCSSSLPHKYGHSLYDDSDSLDSSDSENHPASSRHHQLNSVQKQRRRIQDDSSDSEEQEDDTKLPPIDTSRPKNKESTTISMEQRIQTLREKEFSKKMNTSALHTGQSGLSAIRYANNNIKGINNFNDCSADEIILAVMEHMDLLEVDATSALSFCTLFSHMNAIMTAMKKQKSKTINGKTRLDEVDKELLSLYKDQRTRYENLAKKDRRTGFQVAFLPLTEKDTVHIINSVLKSHGTGESFSYREIDVLTMITLGQLTGRRAFELQTITPADIKFRIETMENGKEIRTLEFTYCWKKNLGIGSYTQKIIESNKLEQNGIVFTLLKMQHQGMIKSAIDVYKGTEVLDLQQYESAKVLQDKLKKASDKLKKKQCEAFQKGSSDPPLGLLKILIDDESKTLMDSNDYRLPFWLAPHMHLNSPTSKRMPESTANEYISLFLCKKPRKKDNHHGYLSSRKNKIGITSTRKAFRNNTHGALSGNSNFDLAGHLMKQMSHTDNVGRSRYESELEYQRTVPANIMQIMDADIADSVFKHAHHPPLYTQDGYFVPGHIFFTDELPSPEDFLTKQSRGIPEYHELYCPVAGCCNGGGGNKKLYKFYSDLLDHHLTKVHMTKCMKTGRKKWKTDQKVQCPACTSNVLPEYYFKRHILKNGGNPFEACPNMSSNIFARQVNRAKKQGQTNRTSISDVAKEGFAEEEATSTKPKSKDEKKKRCRRKMKSTASTNSSTENNKKKRKKILSLPKDCYLTHNGQTCCIAGEDCGLKGVSLDGVLHKCKTCKKLVHTHHFGCSMTPIDGEEGKIFYCVKCGRPDTSTLTTTSTTTVAPTGGDATTSNYNDGGVWGPIEGGGALARPTSNYNDGGVWGPIEGGGALARPTSNYNDGGVWGPIEGGGALARPVYQEDPAFKNIGAEIFF